MRDQKLTKEERSQVARMIDRVVTNNRYPGISDLRNFTLLMFEVHEKKFNLPGISINDFALYCTKNFSGDAIKEMQARIDFTSDLVWALHEKQQENKNDYLPDF